MNYEQAVNSAVMGSGCAAQFNRIFPDAKNIIQYYDGKVGPTSWSSTIGLHGRYVLLMKCPVTLNSDRTKIISEGALELYLYELKSITEQGEGIYNFQVNQFSNDTISAQLWDRLVDANGDFAKIGIILDTQSPVANFESAWRLFK